MKRLALLWDPGNPLTPVAPVVAALRGRVALHEITFQEASHRTSPRGSFELNSLMDCREVDGILWIEGGPFPRDLERLSGLKACWMLNVHAEPTLFDDLRPLFDIRLVTQLSLAGDEHARWLPLAASSGAPETPAPGLWVLSEDPAPPGHVEIERAVRSAMSAHVPPSAPVVLALGQAGQVHPLFFDCLRSSAAVVTDGEADLRGIVHVGEHAERLPSLESVPKFLSELLGDAPRLARLAERGKAVVNHLHLPELRAAQLVEWLWPSTVAYGETRGKPRVSVLVTCYRFLQRLKRCLDSLARQDLPPGTLEVVVADPASPDGLAEYLKEFARRAPHLRLVHLPLDSRYRRNRGLAINRAFDASSGEVVVGIDGDIVFPPHVLRRLADEVEREPGHVYGVRRRFLSEATTARILGGEIDPAQEFDSLVQGAGEQEERGYVGVLGYCQGVRRSAFAQARYPEEFDTINQSDIVFVERLGTHANVSPRFLEDLSVLHLWHPRNWMGTEADL